MFKLALSPLQSAAAFENFKSQQAGRGGRFWIFLRFCSCCRSSRELIANDKPYPGEIQEVSSTSPMVTYLRRSRPSAATRFQTEAIYNDPYSALPDRHCWRSWCNVLTDPECMIAQIEAGTLRGGRVRAGIVGLSR